LIGLVDTGEKSNKHLTNHCTWPLFPCAPYRPVSFVVR